MSGPLYDVEAEVEPRARAFYEASHWIDDPSWADLSPERRIAYCNAARLVVADLVDLRKERDAWKALAKARESLLTNTNKRIPRTHVAYATLLRLGIDPEAP